MVHIKPDHFTLQTASAVSMMKGSSSFVSEWPAYGEEEVGSCIDHQNMTKLFTLLICTPQTVSDISLKSALENLMKEPSSSVSEEMVGSYILYVSRRRTKCIHFVWFARHRLPRIFHWRVLWRIWWNSHPALWVRKYSLHLWLNAYISPWFAHHRLFQTFHWRVPW